jgi:hypothetical protein
MSLYKKLQEARSEEDVKDAYIKALGLKGYVSFKPFEEAYKALTEKLQPMVYESGFLKI